MEQSAQYLRYSETDKEETGLQLGPTATRGVLGTIYGNRVQQVRFPAQYPCDRQVDGTWMRHENRVH